MLRSGLWGKEIEDASLFPLSGEVWNRVFELAKKQTVTGVTYCALQRMPDELLPPKPLLLRWVAEVDVIEQSNRQMNDALAELTGLFANRQLQAVVQKGQGVASFYEAPLLRECGDIDLYFPVKGQREEALQVLKGRGVSPQLRPDGSFEFQWKDIEVEIHSQLLDIQNPFKQKYVNALIEKYGFEEVPLAAAPSVRITVATPVLMLLLLNVHIMKHALGWGIGLRQLCDTARACQELHGRISSDEMHDICQRMGIGRWTRLLHSFMTDYLGLRPDMLPYATETVRCDALLDIVWQGGNFGQYAEGRQTDRAWKRKLHTSMAFCEHGFFSLRYMPQEAFWHFASLVKGQFNRKS